MIANKVDIYDGGVLQPAPWILFLFSLLSGVLNNFYTVRLLFIVFDLLIAVSLYVLTRLLPKSPLKPVQVATCYLYNPMGIFAVFGMNWTLLLTLLKLTALISALKGRELFAAALAGFLLHADVYNFALLAPLAACSKRIFVKSLAFWLVLSVSSMWLMRSVWGLKNPSSLASIFDSIYASVLRIDSLRPNSGMTWYLFAQVFPSYTPLLKITFQLTLMVFWPACALKFRSDPVFMLLMLTGSQMVLKGYPSVSDYALFFGVFTTQAHLFNRSRLLFIALFVAISVYVLQMQIWRYWIEVSGFNANFYYIFTLIWNAALIIIQMDLLAAYNKTKIYENNPKLSGKEYAKCKLFQR